MIRLFVRLLFVLCVAALACDDVLSPRDVEGQYVLERYNGSELPALFLEWSDERSSGRSILLADTLRLFRDRTAVWGKRAFQISTTRGGVETVEEEPGRRVPNVFWFVGDQIRVVPVTQLCPTCSSTFYVDWRGTITDTGIDFGVWSYRRVE